MIVVFDFDGTLTPCDSFFTFARHALGPMRLLVGSLKALPAILAWKSGRITSSQAKQRVYAALYKGMSRRAVTEAAATFKPRFRPEVLSRLIQLRDEGHDVWIVSASLDLWMDEIARRLGVNLLCTETVTAPEGSLTGEFATPNCRGEEKVTRLRAAIPSLSAHRIEVYGNEFSAGGGDAPLAAIASEVVDCSGATDEV